MSSSSMVRWLVIGIGDITTKRVIPAILEDPRSSFVGVVTRNPAKAGHWPGVQVWTDLGEALRSDAIDAVYVASPVLFHAEQTVASLAAGKHVLCEKPVAMNYREARRMAAAGNASAKLLGIAYFRRLFPKVLRAKQLLLEGAIGTPVLAEGHCHGWLESEERGWLRDPALAGGGPLYDIGSHRIDLMNFLFGAPARATGLLSNAFHPLAVEDSASVLIDYANKARGIVDVRWNSRIVRDEFRIIGSEGEIDLTPLHGHTLRLNGTHEDHPRHPNVHFPLVQNFAAAVLDGSPLACTVDDAIQTDWITGEVMSAMKAD